MYRNLNTRFTLKTLCLAVAAAAANHALAQGSESLALEEVVVTAQKRAASVQDIAATVNVVTGDAVEKFAKQHRVTAD